MTETKRIGGDVVADLERLLEPHLVVTELAWLPPTGPVRVEAQVKGAELPAGFRQADMRAAIFASAQEAIRVVEDAGYSHNEQPVIHIGAEQQQREDGTAMTEIRGSVWFMLRPPGLTH